MKKRKLDTKKFYKLIKILVISVSIITGLVAVYGWHEAYTASILENGFAMCDHIYPTYFNMPASEQSIHDANNRCMIDVLTQDKEADAFTYEATTITILLPVFFFGGSWLYKYLFPVKNKKENEKS